MKILIVGAGTIAKEYVKALLAQQITPIVIGRGEAKVTQLKKEYPHVEAYPGGLENWLGQNQPPKYAIVATPIDYLAKATQTLINAGCQNLLVEKPLTYSALEAQELSQLAKEKDARVHIAFNRRSYRSVKEARKLIEKDGGVCSFHFDFTEAIFRIDETKFNTESQRHWGIANSSHVIDTAFYLGGKPNWIEAHQYGKAINWHPAGSIFTGIGETTEGVPFTYHANWGCPGRWSIEIMTPKRKLLFSPMEKLHQQLKDSFKIELVELNYSLDTDYKPGFYLQLKEFMDKPGYKCLMNADELVDELRQLNEIFGY